MSRDVELVVDLTTSVLAGPRSAGMSRVEREFANSLATQHDGPMRRVVWDSVSHDFQATESAAPLVEVGGVSDSISRRVLLVTGGGWLSNPVYLHALGRYRDRLGAELVVVIHDVLPIIRPHWFPLHDAARNAAGIATMLASADGALVYSTSTHDDLLEATSRLHLPPTPCRRITLGAGVHVPAGPGVPACATRLGGRPFVLFVSTLTFRKNHEFLCNVWRRLIGRLGDRMPRLLLVGRTAPDQAALADRLRRDRELAGHVQQMDDVDDAGLTWLYEHCLFTVYPSLYEGWGLPVSESLSHGKICVAADTSSLREAAADVSPLLDPFDHAAWCDFVTRLVVEPGVLAAHEARLRGRPPQPSWSDAARSVLEATATAFPRRASGVATSTIWHEGWESPPAAGSQRVLGRSRLGLVLDDVASVTGVALSAVVSAPVPSRLDIVANGAPVAGWVVDAVPAAREILIPGPVVATRAMLDLEFEVRPASGELRPGDTPGPITLGGPACRPLSATEADLALARHRVWLAEGDIVQFGLGHRGGALLGEGWNTPAPWGAWSEGSEAVVTFAPVPATGRTLYLRLWARAFVLPQAPTLDVEVVVDGTDRTRWDLAHPADALPVERVVRIEDAGELVSVRFRIPGCRSPQEIGLGPDARRLGLGLMCAQWLSTPPVPGDRLRGLPTGVG